MFDSLVHISANINNVLHQVECEYVDEGEHESNSKATSQSQYKVFEPYLLPKLPPARWGIFGGIEILRWIPLFLRVTQVVVGILITSPINTE